MKNKIRFDKKVQFFVSVSLLALHAQGAVASPGFSPQVVVNFKGERVNLLELVAEDERVGALGEFTQDACYRGDSVQVIQALNGVFRLFVRSDRLAALKLPATLRSASSQKIGQAPGTINIQYEKRLGDGTQKSFAVAPCRDTTPEAVAPRSQAPAAIDIRQGAGTVNVLELISEDARLDALLQLGPKACYSGELIETVRRLNGVFNMAEASEHARAAGWVIRYVQATTPKLDEPRTSIGVEFERVGASGSRKRFLIPACR